MSDALQINGPRLLHSLHELGQFGVLPGGGTNRLALSDADKAARDWTVAHMQALGMSVQVDAIGNVVATYAGNEALPPVMTGSISTPCVPAASTTATTASWPASKW